jgi:hypothetical protein
MATMDQRGSAAEPFSTSSPLDVPAARLQAWVRIAARLGAGTVIPSQDSAAA